MKRKQIIKPIPALTLREACISRGINPDATGYRAPSQRLLAVDRIIPGIADRVSPSVEQHRSNAQPRRMYTRTSAQNDRAIIAQSDTPVAAYVAAFCRLNNLTASA